MKKTNAFSMGPFFRTIQYLKPYQVWARIDYRLRSYYYSSFLYPALEEPADVPEKLICSPRLLWTGKKNEGRAITAGKFTFVGRTIHMGKTVQWLPGEASPLWQYHLHYFNWLVHLRSLEDEGRTEAQRLIEDWLLSFSDFHKTVWHPYPLSLRIVSWLTHAEWLLEGARAEFREIFMGSLVRQVDHLEKVLEWDVGGNHLFKNVKALVYAGLCLPGRQTTFLDGLGILLSQLKVQILEDGAHFERSPHYHVDVLQDLLEIHAVMKKAGHPHLVQLGDAIDRMMEALVFYRYPDGKLGLFNDGELGDKAHISKLIKYCGYVDPPGNQLKDAGYIRLERKKTMLMFDAGLCCPDELPAHAHADMLSFEMCVGEERVFVNSGTYAYQHAARNRFRGTAAHNTVCVDGQDSAEVWKVFRLGRRPRQVTSVLREEKKAGIYVEGEHDGYRHLGVSHKRSLFLSEDGEDVRGEDIITGKKQHKVAAHFHLHPDIKCHLKTPNEAHLETPSGLQLVFKVRGGKIAEQEGSYAPLFGEIFPSRQLIVKAEWGQKKGARINWAIKHL